MRWRFKEAKGKRFFFEKKKQKTFKCAARLGVYLDGDASCEAPGEKFFGSFFQKRTSFLSLKSSTKLPTILE
jgi:hypothetical protein